MNTRDIASEYRLSQWAKILGERSGSGMSIKGYCETAGIRESVYYYWQRKLREAACEELSTRTRNEAGSCETTHNIPNGWALCKSSENTNQGKPLVIEVNGFRVHVEPDTALEEVTKVCRALKALC